MIDHLVRVQRPGERLGRDEQLAWKLAEVATDRTPIDSDVEEMVINRVIDNAAVAAASLSRTPVIHARAQALRHVLAPGATVFGCPVTLRVSPEWAAWANCVAVRELDFHDTFIAKEFAHPGDNIPALAAIAQHTGRSGSALVRAITVAYEVQIDLARAISLHAHGVDHIAHLGVSIAAGLGALMELPTETVYQAIQQALHTTTTTRQSRKGEISSWKAYAPAFAAKMAIEAIDRAMLGEASPSPIYEGEDGVIARMLDGPGANYVVALPAAGEPKRAILESFTKQYSAEYQSQSFIDLARRMRNRIPDLSRVRSVTIATSRDTHLVIGSGSYDPEKMDPDASRETLDHSLMYIFAIALEDRTIHHERSYERARSHRPETVELWQKISTVADARWTTRNESDDPVTRAFGGTVRIVLDSGEVVEDEIALADAHPLGTRPFTRSDYLEKFRVLAGGVVAEAEQKQFLQLAQGLGDLAPVDLGVFSFAATSASSSALSSKGLL